GVLFTIMTTWRRGRAILADPCCTESFHFPLKLYVNEIAETNLKRDDRTAIVMTAVEDMVPLVMQQDIQRCHVVPGRFIMLTIHSRPVPRVRDDDAVTIRDYGSGCYGITATHGFMESPDIRRFLAICTRKGLDLDCHRVYYYLSRM